MNKKEEKRSQWQHDDDHENDIVMPGFRFHPTEEELVEFYLRRKVEGKSFNIELITFLDLYRYDPWELPALASLGEKEWFFYVPRDRKYRNGDRPNRATTSGYWKATGADRMIRNANFRSIGLKKTLVFYSGKAPKGIRSRWIMNEYRLPQPEFQRLQKSEISLCRVYKRTGVEVKTTRSISRHSSQDNKPHLQSLEGQSYDYNIEDKNSDKASLGTALTLLNPSISSSYNHNNTNNSFPNSVSDLHRMLGISQQALDNSPPSQLLNMENDHQLNVRLNYSPPLISGNNMLPQHPQAGLQSELQSEELFAPNLYFQGTFPDRHWEWNTLSNDGSKDIIDPFD